MDHQIPSNLSPKDKIKVIKLLRAKEAIEKDNVLKNMKFNLVSEAFLLCKAKIRILCGANQSGKSTTGGADLLIKAGQAMPDSLKDSYPLETIKPGEYWAAAVDFPSSHDVQEKKIFELVPKRNIQQWNKEFRELHTENKSVIGFKSAESGREKFQGSVKRGFWGDEELPEAVWDESYMRVIALAGFMTLTFSPLKGLTYAYSKLWKKSYSFTFTKNKHNIPEEVGLVHTLEEIKLLRQRELVVLNNTENDVDPNIQCFQMSAYDNEHLSDQEIQNAERKYKDDAAQYNARILGRFTKLTGNNVFNIQKLIKYQAKCPTIFKRGDIMDRQFRSNVHGKLVVFQEKKSFGSGFYVIGADCSEGLIDGDNDCAQVLDHLTGEQVAVWHGKVPIEEFGSILYELGMYYNTAFLAPERNFQGIAVINKLRDKKYPRLFCDYEPIQQVLKSEVQETQKKYGWETNLRTKPILVGDLAECITTGQIRLNDIATIEELITYVNKGDGKTGALGGCYDDRVIALGIAIQVLKHRKPPIKDIRVGQAPVKKDPFTGY